MIAKDMYVRFESDYEDNINPRIFICGQIVKIDNFTEKALIKIHDPFDNIQYFPDLKRDKVEMSLVDLEHCRLFEGSRVIHNNNEFEILAYKKEEDSYYYYYLQNIRTKEIEYVSEIEIIAAFNNGKISPVKQLYNYEFQNPAWFLCRNIVSKNLNVLDNSIAGFKDLAGCKIFLLPHQVNTIMRCLQGDTCRFMLADEVGMGKTIEALSIYKLFIKTKFRAKSLILVPDALKEQWKIEMFLKFNILPGIDRCNNELIMMSPNDLDSNDLLINWDFVIIDEVHNYLNSTDYEKIHKLSKSSKNILLLSATPVQQREKEYLDLLRLLSPKKYDKIELNDFISLISKQKKIIQQSTNILGDIEDYYDEIETVLDEGDLPEETEDCKDLFNEIKEQICDLSENINDSNLYSLVDEISFDNEEYGINEMKIVISYICSNYQIENSIIRNRRKLLEKYDDEEEYQMPIRKLIELSYDLDFEINTYESNTYKNLVNWLNNNKCNNDDFVKKYVKPLFSSFFSSVFAYENVVNLLNISDKNIVDDLVKWKADEEYLLNNINDILENQDEYEDSYNSRIVKIVNFLYEDISKEKVVLFTNYTETFDVYEKVLIDVFGQEKVCTFAKTKDNDLNELNVYRFQTDNFANILLCDETGGEGRNFQCADYVIHIELPLDANTIEQRIGRLDRLERDPNRPVVNSVVVHTNHSFENELFNFWNLGLNIFCQSLSGMEIIMNDINNEIYEALEIDVEYELAERIPEIIEKSNKLSSEINKERNFDTAAIMYRPLFLELQKLITYYSENENSIFTKSMSTWASMAGLIAEYNNGIISYYPGKFSNKSAQKSLLMPPKFSEYMLSSHNQFITNVTNMYNNNKIHDNDRSIRGTFERKQAIESDYLHFFAPGDAIFDCIIDNAMNTCKGSASAFAFESEYNWKGFFFTFKLTPNIMDVIKENKSFYLLNSYRTYLCNDLISIPVSLENFDNISNEKLTREFNRVINLKISRNSVVSFGKRSKGSKFLLDEMKNDTNIEWFKKMYTSNNWSRFVLKSYQKALNEATNEFDSRSNIAGAKEEMQRQISTRIASLGFYDIDDDSIEIMKNQNDVVLKALKNANVVIDSACFVWMVKK